MAQTPLQEMFEQLPEASSGGVCGPNTDPPKVFGRLGIGYLDHGESSHLVSS